MWNIHLAKAMAEYYKNCLLIERKYIANDIELVAKYDKVINLLEKFINNNQMSDKEQKEAVKCAADVMAERAKRYAKTEQEKQTIELQYEQTKLMIDSIKTSD